MRQNNIKPMIESGVMAGILFILNTINYYFPLLGLVVFFVLVVPPAILGRKYGVKWATLSIIASSILQTVLMGPQVVLSGLPMAVLGVVFAYAYQKEWSAAKRVIIPSVVFPLSVIIQILLASYVAGIDVNGIWQGIVDQNLESQEMFLSARGLTEEQIAVQMVAVKQRVEEMVYVMPTLVVISGLILSFISVKATDKILNRLKISFKPFKTLARWEMPNATVAIFAISGVMLYWGQALSMHWLSISGANIMMATLCVILIQGIVVIKRIFEFKNFPNSIFYLMVGLIFLMPLLAYIVFILGGAEMLSRYWKQLRRE